MAFEISKSTLYNWKRQLKAHGTIGLSKQSTAPKSKRKRNWNIAITTEIRALRSEYPNLGKDKLHHLLKPWCAQRHLPVPSISTIGRLIADSVDKMRITALKPMSAAGRVKGKQKSKILKTRRAKGYKSKAVGECVGIDAVERRMGSMKRHLLTYIDEFSGYAVALAIPKLNSAYAAQFLKTCIRVSPFSVQGIVTDNGSEFHKHFDECVSDAGIKKLWTYPSTPKMNACCERFNRTIQEQFVDYHEHLLFEDPDEFNNRLADWLILYNSKIPRGKKHGFKTPIQVILENQPQCNMYWTYTLSCLFQL
jgi:transposase InsO family protein